MFEDVVVVEDDLAGFEMVNSAGFDLLSSDLLNLIFRKFRLGAMVS